MPTRAALRVINRHLTRKPGCRELTSNLQDAVVAAYQVLADAMGATLEVTLDGQVVLYTGHFKSDVEGVEDPKTPEYFDLHAPKTQRDLSTPEARAAALRKDAQSPEESAQTVTTYVGPTGQQVAIGYIKGRVPTPEDLTLEELEELKNKRLLADRGPVFTVGETTDAAVEAYYANLAQ